MNKILITALLATSALSAQAMGFKTNLDATALPADVNADTGNSAPFIGAGKTMMDDQAVQLVKGSYDLENGTVTLPLYQGSLASGETVWYIMVDASDAAVADELGVNYSSKLGNVPEAAGRTATGDMHGLVFNAGGVDFSPERSLTPGEAPALFPPSAFQPGSVGDADYSPYARLESGVVVNAPTVAFNVDADTLNAMCEGEVDHAIVTDRTTAICPRDGTITLAMTQAVADGHYSFFISPDSSGDLGATLEAATFAPRLANFDFAADADAEGSALEQNVVWVNGQTEGAERQGIISTLMTGLSPLDTLGDIPSLGDGYSPAWSIFGTLWTDEALQNGTARRLTHMADVIAEAEKGNVTGITGKFEASGFMVNCPVVLRVN